MIMHWLVDVRTFLRSSLKGCVDLLHHSTTGLLERRHEDVATGGLDGHLQRVGRLATHRLNRLLQTESVPNP